MLGVVDLQWLQWIGEAIVPKTGGWTLWVFHLTPAVVFLVGGGVAIWRFRWFRMGEPAVNIDMEVASLRCSDSFVAISAVAVLTNASRVLAKCNKLRWEVRVLAPYRDEDVQHKVDEYSGYHEVETIPIEFPWNLNYNLSRNDSRIFLEPGEKNTVNMNLAIPDWITAIDVQLSLQGAKGNKDLHLLGLPGASTTSCGRHEMGIRLDKFQRQAAQKIADTQIRVLAEEQIEKRSVPVAVTLPSAQKPAQNPNQIFKPTTEPTNSSSGSGPAETSK